MGVFDFYKQARRQMHRFSLGHWEELSQIELVLIYPWWVIYQVIRELVKDRGLVRASSLAFTTVLSIVPVLTVATTLLGAFGTAESAVMKVMQTLLPFEGETIAGHITQFVESQAGAISGIGAVVLIFLGVALFNNIEHAFNDIWKVTQRRPLLDKFLTFYALITLAPLMMAISIVQSAKVQFVVEQVPFGAQIGYKLLPIGLGWVIFSLGNKLLPYTKVKWLPALVSGLITAVAFELAKFGFNIYVTTFIFETYSKVYGAIGLIPIFLIWVYVSWVIVLFGAELTYTIQNLRSLLVPARVSRLARRKDRQFAPLVALDVFAPIAVAFKRADGPVHLERVAASASVPVELARVVLDHLVEAGVVLELTHEAHDETESDESAGFLPARPLTDVPLHDLIVACRPEDNDAEGLPFVSAIRRVHDAREREVFKGLTCEALVSETTWEKTRDLANSLAASLDTDRRAAGTGRRRSASDVLERIAVEADSVIGKLKGEIDKKANGKDAPAGAVAPDDPGEAEKVEGGEETEEGEGGPSAAELRRSLEGDLLG